MSAAKNKYLKPSAKFESRVELTGSFRKFPAGINTGNTSFNQVIEVMIKLRRKAPVRNLIRGIATGKNKPVTQEVFEKRFGASTKDIDLVLSLIHI